MLATPVNRTEEVSGGPPTLEQSLGAQGGVRLGEGCLWGNSHFLFKHGPGVLTKQKAGTGRSQVLDVD